MGQPSVRQKSGSGFDVRQCATLAKKRDIRFTIERSMSAVSQAPPHTGTTIVACEYDGGVVLGADTRVSTGAFVYATTTRDSTDSSLMHAIKTERTFDSTDWKRARTHANDD